MKIKVAYYAFLTPDDDMSDVINIVFPGLPGCCSCAYSKEEAKQYASDALSLFLHGTECDKLPPMISLSELPSHESKTDVYKVVVEMEIKDGKMVGEGVIDYPQQTDFDSRYVNANN